MKKVLVLIAGVILSTAAFAASKTDIAASHINIKTPHVKAITSANGNTQVFMDLINTGSHSHKVVAAISPVAKLAQIHKTTKHGMKQVESIKILPHHDRDLHKGGFHIMLMELNQNLQANQNIPVMLIFEDGSHITVNAKVDQKA